MRTFRTILISLAVMAMTTPFAFSQPTVSIATGNSHPWAGEQLPHNGFILHVITESFQNAGYEVEYTFLPWARAKEEALRGDFDATAYWYESDKYRKDFLLSAPLSEAKTVFFYRDVHPRPGWETLSDLKDLKIGAAIGYTYTKDFWEMTHSKELNVHLAHKDETNFNMLLKGRIDMVLCSVIRGQKIIRDRFTPEIANTIHYDPKPLFSSGTHLMINKKTENADQILNDFNRGFQKLMESGGYEILWDDLLIGVYSEQSQQTR